MIDKVIEVDFDELKQVNNKSAQQEKQIKDRKLLRNVFCSEFNLIPNAIFPWLK